MSLKKLEQDCLGCTACPLSETRHNVVFGVGNPNARLMLIGEGPGEQEDLKGEPFVGRAGKLLDDLLSLIDLDRETVYIANMVKCRPPGNRDPLPLEKQACAGWLDAQITLIDPEIIVCLGRVAAMRFLGDGFKITAEHGKWFDCGGRKVMAVFHPAALLRDPRKRPETFDDLKAIQRALAGG